MAAARTRTADFLLIDIGNTAVKLRLSNRAALVGATRRVPTAMIVGRGRVLRDGRVDRPAAMVGGRLPREPVAALTAALQGWRFGQVVLCSVVPAATARVEAALATHAPGTPLVRVTSSLRGLGVDLSAYKQRRTLGADRLANMAGALALYGVRSAVGGSTGGEAAVGGNAATGLELIVVDFGTAATFNALDAGGRFLGGVIAPGLASMSGYLSARASQLPALGRLGAAPASAIGRSTRAAMLAGTVFGYRGLVREVLDSLRVELPGAKVIATGGDARFIARLLPSMIDAVEPDLTLHGLCVIGAGLLENPRNPISRS